MSRSPERDTFSTEGLHGCAFPLHSLPVHCSGDLRSTPRRGREITPQLGCSLRRSAAHSADRPLIAQIGRLFPGCAVCSPTSGSDCRPVSSQLTCASVHVSTLVRDVAEYLVPPPDRCPLPHLPRIAACSTICVIRGFVANGIDSKGAHDGNLNFTDGPLGRRE